MAALGRIVGPVPFKDVVHKEDDEHPPEEYADIISTLLSITTGFGPLLRYQGVWLRPWMVPGVIAVQRHLAPRPDDVLLASPPKCGTTWLKALSLATMARATYPPSSADHPLLRLNPHDCVPHLEALFSAGQEAKLEALPSRRLMHTHMHHSLLPPSLADCKIIYVCRYVQLFLSVVSGYIYYKSTNQGPDGWMQGAQGYAGFHVALHHGCRRRRLPLLRAIRVCMRG